MGDAVVLDATLSMAANVGDRGVIVVVGEVEVKIDPGVNGLPHIVPTLLVSILTTTLTTLLTPRASP
jgi:hypothetical protein